MATPSSGLGAQVEGQRRQVAALDVEHGDVEVGVVVDDVGVDGLAVDLDLRVVDAGHDVGVGHQPVGGVEEAGALDAAAAVVAAADLEHAGLGVARRRGRCSSRSGPGGDVDDPLRRERLEVAREEAGADDVVEGLQQAAGATAAARR